MWIQQEARQSFTASSEWQRSGWDSWDTSVSKKPGVPVDGMAAQNSKIGNYRAKLSRCGCAEESRGGWEERSNPAATSRNPAELKWAHLPDFLKVESSWEEKMEARCAGEGLLSDLTLFVSCFLSSRAFHIVSHSLLWYTSFLIISAVNKHTTCVYREEITPVLASPLRVLSVRFHTEEGGGGLHIILQ